MRLHAKLLSLLVPCVSAPLLVVGWIAFDQLNAVNESQRTRRAETLLAQLEMRTRSFIETARANASLFADSRVIQNYLLVEDERDRYELHLEGVLSQLASFQRAYPDYYEIRLLLPNGYEDVRSTLVPSANATEQETGTALFRELHSRPVQTFNTVRTNPDNGEPALYVSRRIWIADTSRLGSSAKRELRGYLVITSALDFLLTAARDLHLAGGEHLYFSNGAGIRLRHSDSPREHVGLTPGAAVAAMQAASNGDSTTVSLDGESHRVVSRRLAENINAHVALPASQFESAARRLASLVGLVTLIAIVLTAALLYRAIGALLLVPLRKLGAAADAIGRGEQIDRVGIACSDEIGALATRFEEMCDNLRASADQVRFLAFHDGLTGLANRRMFVELVGHALSRAARHGDALGLLFIDVDDFKRVNDTLGHQAGDELLKSLAERIQAELRDGDPFGRLDDADDERDTLARVGGDEFIVLLHDLDQPLDAAVSARRLLHALAQPFVIKGHAFHVGSSIGISTFPENGHGADVLIKHAELAMQHAKSRGKNNFQFYDGSMNAAAVERLALENELRHALERDELVLHYQPQIDTVSGEVVAVEALVRWEHPSRGLMPPSLFIGLAEETGLIGSLGDWVLTEACRQARRWSEGTLGRIRVCVNISNRQFKNPEFRSTIERIVASSGIEPELLEIELTESSVMDAGSHGEAALRALKAMGVRIAMDDFGTGYSSFGALRRLPIDTLKIDRSFVRDIVADADDAAIVAAIISMTRSLGLHVVAEGVENAEQLAILRAHGCRLIQGYLFARPLPALEIPAFVDQHVSECAMRQTA